MFDKLYKEANDEIPINTELMERLKNEASKGKRKNPYGFMYRYGFAAAAVLIVAVSLNVLPEMKNNQKNEEKYPGTTAKVITQNDTAKIHETSENSANDKASDISVSEDNDLKNTGIDETKVNREAGNSTQNDKAVNNSSASVPNFDDISKTGESTVKEDAAKNIPYSSATNESTTPHISDSLNQPQGHNNMENAEENAETDSAAEQQAIPQEKRAVITAEKEQRVSGGSAGGGGGSTSSSAAGYKAMVQQDIISLSDYCSYFGFNSESWNLPAGMSLIQGEEVYVTVNSQTQNYEDTEHTVIYSGGGKKVSVTMVPNGADVAALINSGSGGKYNGNALIIENSASYYTVYAEKNGRGYIIEIENLEKENVYSLIDSIG